MSANLPAKTILGHVEDFVEGDFDRAVAYVTDGNLEGVVVDEETGIISLSQEMSRGEVDQLMISVSVQWKDGENSALELPVNSSQVLRLEDVLTGYGEAETSVDILVTTDGPVSSTSVSDWDGQAGNPLDRLLDTGDLDIT